MPQDPHTWTASEYVSAGRLDYDLYSAGAGFPVTSYFIPNGIRWHSRKALYKTYQAAAVTIGAGTWARQFTGIQNNANVMNDTSGRYGVLMDPLHSGVITDAIFSSGGGLPNATGGGWYLMTGFVNINGGSSTNNFQAGISQNAVTPISFGTSQKGNPAHNTTPFVVDLIKTGVSPWTLNGWNGSASSVSTSANTDGSQSATRFTAQWASVIAGSGSDVTVSAPAPKASWASTDTMTAAFLNGNTGIRDVIRSWNWPPALRAHDAVGTSILPSNATALPLSVDLDTYAGFSGSTYTVPRKGLYLVHGIVAFPNFPAQAMAGVNINGTIYWGPAMPAASAGTVTGSKTQIFSLNAGDTIQLMAFHNAGVSETTSTASPSRLVVLKVSDFGTPATLPAVPDLSYRWTAGMPPDLSATLNAHLANDLTFLTNKPYLMSWQSAATTGIAMNTDANVIMNNETGQVHSDSGDNYNGFSTTTGVYTCQRSGWYLAVSEIFMSFPSLTTQPSNAAGFRLNVTGAAPADRYQQATPTNATNMGGATALGYYYLRAGDTIQPTVYTIDSSSTTTSTSVTGRNSHFELVWISE